MMKTTYMTTEGSGLYPRVPHLEDLTVADHLARTTEFGTATGVGTKVKIGFTREVEIGVARDLVIGVAAVVMTVEGTGRLSMEGQPVGRSY